MERAYPSALVSALYTYIRIVDGQPEIESPDFDSENARPKAVDHMEGLGSYVLQKYNFRC